MTNEGNNKKSKMQKAECNDISEYAYTFPQLSLNKVLTVRTLNRYLVSSPSLRGGERQEEELVKGENKIQR